MSQAQALNDRPNPTTIASQNDGFRRFACLGETPQDPVQGRLVVTHSVAEAGDGFALMAVKAVGEFDTFEPDNDPNGWHDFGSFELQGETLFWKIDLYETSSDFRFGAETPEDPSTTTCVLTIMMARDW